jgi:hypothetical protein
MTAKPLLARIVLVASAVCAPLWAQTPLFTDGPAFGGSKVFSEGMNPLANPARFGQAPTGYYFSFVDGDQRAQDNKSRLSDATSGAPATLGPLADAPWALRTRAYGLSSTKNGANLALTREEFNSMLFTNDTAGLNGPFMDGRRATVDRLSVGGGGPAQQGSTTAMGVNLRIERWAMGEIFQPYNSATPGALNFGSAESDMLNGTGTSNRSWNLAMDAGVVLEMAQGVRLGVTADQINPKHLWDVYLQPQFRAGLQLDLGQLAKLSLESDLNSVERMPFPVKQQASAASLRFGLSSAAALLVGVERRKIDNASVTRGGATLQIRTSSLLLAIGFQAGQDRPMKSATLMVN